MRATVNPWRALATVLVGVLAAITAGASYSASSVTTSAGAPAAAPKPATAAQWARIVTAAKREGSVTLYTTQNPATIAEMAAKFKALYGISVTVNRAIDSVLAQQITAEHGANNVKVDLWVSASKPLVLGAHQQENQWVANAVAPNLFTKAYDRKKYTLARSFIVGVAVQGMGWNTTQFPQGLKDLPDLLNPRLKGRIGIFEPAAPSQVDYYLWVQDTYGMNFLPRLAQQEPKLYVGSLPMTQAVASGEIAASHFVVGNILDLKKQGAPVGFALAKGQNTWNAPFYGMILKKAQHPNAAQLLANYMVTREGQATSMRLSGSIVKGIPDTFYVTPRKQDLRRLTKEKVAAFQRYFNSLFK